MGPSMQTVPGSKFPVIIDTSLNKIDIDFCIQVSTIKKRFQLLLKVLNCYSSKSKEVSSLDI